MLSRKEVVLILKLFESVLPNIEHAVDMLVIVFLHHVHINNTLSNWTYLSTNIYIWSI